MLFNHFTIVHPSMHFIGGAERLMTDLALGLADEGAKVEVVTGTCHNYWRSELSQKANCVSVKELGRATPGNLGFWLNVKGFAKAFSRLISPETDLIVTSSFPSSLVADLFTKWHDVKVVHYLHEAPMVLHDKEGLKTLPLRLRVFYRFASAHYAKADVETVRKSNLILANSQLSKRVNAVTYGVDESSIEVIYPGVNVERMAASAVEPQLISTYVRDGVPVIFFPRGAQFWRNPEICLQALQKLRIRDFVAIFTGGADYEAAALIKHAKALRLADKVFWIQELLNEELNAMYSRSSLVVSIPRRESFGLIPLEALACGTPPIISSSSGVSEVLRDGIDAICVHADDSKQLADAIGTLILDAETRTRIISNGKRRVLAEFTSSRFVKELMASLSKLAS
jgi:glycosyltransferase involved in cell wall biosynthesis